MSYEDEGYAEYLENQAQDEELKWLESESAAAEAEAKNEENEYYELIGKFYELLNLNGSVMARIKINYVRRIHEDGIKNNDESFSPAHSYIQVSENGSAWFTFYGGNYDRIV